MSSRSLKLKVVEYAEANNNCAAACEFCINEKQVREWQKNKTTLKDMPRSKKKCPMRCASFPERQKDLNNWVVECRQNGYIVTRTGICLCALQMSKNDKYKSCTRFMNCHGLCLRQRTKIAQKLPRDLEEKNKSFQRFMIKYRKEYAFELSQTGNMDETLMTFDLPKADDEKESASEDDTANIYDDNAGAAVTEAEFNELFGESETDSDFKGF
uniref:Brinker DNA-binding domain-containing protein n=1 Tax=Chrysemys picta bellii TaxID=8478 RepID=A0A8C3EZS2_CHRPI